MSTNNTKQAAWVAIGSVSSFGFSFVSSMILSRYFNKGDYGTYQQVLFIYHTFLSVFTLGLPKAYSYFLPRVQDFEAKDVINKINYIFFFMGGLLSLILYFTSPVIASFMNNQELIKALRIFAPVPFLMLPTMGLEGILATYKKTHMIALYTFITRLLLLLCVSTPVVFFEGTYIHAIIGFTIASFFSFCYAILLKYYPVRLNNHEKSNVTYADIFKFSIPLLFASIWGILINSTDQFFISRYFGKQAYAEFSNGAIEFPVASLLISACSTILIPLFSKQAMEGGDYKNTILPVWSNALRKSCLVLYPMIIFCIYEAKPLLSLLYGIQYENSGYYFIVKIITNFVKIIPFAAILIAIGAVKYYSKVMMLIFCALAVLEYLSVLVFPHNPYILVLIHSILIILQVIIYVIYIAKYMNVRFKDIVPLPLMGKIICMSLVCLLLVISVRNLISIPTKSLMLLFDLTLYSLSYFLISTLFGIDYMNIIRPLIKQKNEKTN